MSRIVYLAGFFDGEGHIALFTSGTCPTLQLRLFVGQNDKRPLVMFHEMFEGSITSRVEKTGNVFWVWQASALKAEHALRTMLPYLVVKRGEAEIALEARKLIGKRGQRVTKVQIEERMEFIEKLRAERKLV